MQWSKPIVEEKPIPYCRSGKDGDCGWSQCPQEKDNGAHRMIYCPYAAFWEMIWEEES